LTLVLGSVIKLTLSMQDQIAKELEKIGLSEKEAKVYLAGLELGPSTAQTIAAKATVNRPTTYIMIESLIKRGLMSSFEKGKKRFFVSTQPDHLRYIINQQKHEIIEKEKVIDGIVTMLRPTVVGGDKRPSVQIFEGLNGLHAIQEIMVATQGDELFELVSVDDSKKILPPIFEGDIRTSILDKYKIKSLYTHSSGPTLISHQNVESRHLSNGVNPVGADVTVFENKVVFISYRNNGPVSILVDDTNIAASIRTMFLALWNQAK